MRSFAPTIVCLLLAMTGCVQRKSSEAESAIKESNSDGSAITVCPCNDRACWQRETDSRSAENIQCARNALGQAFPFFRTIDGIVSAGEALAETQSALADLSSGLNIAASGMQIVEQLLPECAGATTAISTAAVDIGAKSTKFVDLANKFNRQEPSSNFEMDAALKIISSAADLLESVTRAYTAVDRINKCLTAANNSSNSDVALETAKVSTLASRAKEAITKTQKKFAELNPAQQIKVGQTIIDCGVRNVRGIAALKQNFQCMLDDLDEVRAGRARVSRALAYDSARQHNHARFIGCSACVRSNSNDNYGHCRNCCEQYADVTFPETVPRTKYKWTLSCQLTCGIAGKEGDRALCADVLQFSPTSRNYRFLDMFEPGVDPKTLSNRVAVVRREKDIIIAHLRVLKDNFDVLLKLTDVERKAIRAGTEFQLFHVDMLALAARDPSYPQNFRDAAEFFGVKFPTSNGLTYWGKKLDTASGHNGMDFLVGKNDIDAMVEEVEQFFDESDFPGSAADYR